MLRQWSVVQISSTTDAYPEGLEIKQNPERSGYGYSTSAPKRESPAYPASIGALGAHPFRKL